MTRGRRRVTALPDLAWLASLHRRVEVRRVEVRCWISDKVRTVCREPLLLIADGATNQAAARQLLISETTVKTHLLHIYTKLGVRDRASAVATAYKRGLLG